MTNRREYSRPLADISVSGVSLVFELDLPAARHGKPNAIVSGDETELVGSATLARDEKP